MNFLTQPFSRARLGSYLQEHLADPHWIFFRGAVAFVRRSGTQHIRHLLREFRHWGQVRLSVGIDLQATSQEGLLDLLEALPDGQIWIYSNNGPYTFHPKVYLFKSHERADLVVGSGNLTGGGLFTNYEASLAVTLNLGVPDDVALVQSVEAVLDSWSQHQDRTCLLLTHHLLHQLVEAHLVRPEAEQKADPDTKSEAVTAGEIQAARLFRAIAVPRAPTVVGEILAHMKTAGESAPELRQQAAVPVPPVAAVFGSFVMTLHKTDAGHGQTTKGTARRSPEVFIPLAALDENPAFWTFPDKFAADAKWDAKHPKVRRNGIGKRDRIGVPMRIGAVQTVNMFFNPRKKDFRLRNEVLRSSGKVGDIILIQRVNPANGFEYDIHVAPRGSPFFKDLQPRCKTPVPNSPKLFGYF